MEEAWHDDISVLEEKSSIKMLGLSFSSELDLGYHIVSISKTASNKIGARMCFIKFISPDTVLYHYKFTNIQPSMEYCCYVWAGSPSYSLYMLDKSLKQACRTVGPSLAASLEQLGHFWNIPSLIFSVGTTYVDVHLNSLNWFHFVILVTGPINFYHHS